MRIEKRDGIREREILGGMVNHPSVLGRIAAKWTKEGLFFSPWANIVGKMCVDFYRKYHDAPGRGIESLLRSWVERNQDQATIDLVEKFAGCLSEEYAKAKDGLNVELLVDIAGNHFNKAKLSSLVERVQTNLDAGDQIAADEAVTSYSKVELGAGAGIPIMTDKETVMARFARENIKPAISYPGALGQFFGDAFRRSGFISFISPEKTGKSMMLLDVAYRAMLQRRKVVFFSIGDMMDDEVSLRFLARAASHPAESPTGRWPCTVKVPLSIRHHEGDTSAMVDFRERQFKFCLQAADAWGACERIMQEKTRSNRPYLLLSCHSNLAIGVHGIRAVLDSLELKNYVPDVVVIDYADNLEPPPGYRETRDQINATWKLLRALSMDRRCLVVTATQSDADSYDRAIMSRSNFSEDKRKLAHVTGLVGINVTAEEKEGQVMRLNWIVRRHGEYSWKRCVHVATCLALSNPTVRSCWSGGSSD